MQRNVIFCYIMAIMSTAKQLTDDQRLVLRHLIDLNLKSASKLAAEAGINRGSLISGISGNRGIPGHKVHTLLNVLGLDERWEPLHNVAHYLRVNADAEPLINVIDVIFGSAKMYALQTPGQKLIEWEPYTGFFLFEYNTPAGKGLTLVHRDRYRAGKGVVTEFNPEHAKAIEPALFKNVAWADDPIVELDEDLIKQLEIPFYKREDGPSLNRLREILNMSAVVSWTEVMAAAKKHGLTAEDVLKLIQK